MTVDLSSVCAYCHKSVWLHQMNPRYGLMCREGKASSFTMTQAAAVYAALGKRTPAAVIRGAAHDVFEARHPTSE